MGDKSAFPWMEIGIQTANMMYDQLTAHQQFNRQKKLMDLQQQNQMALNKQGQEIQLDTWEKTNYPAQVEMLKKAGLNPGLLYSKGGAGGTTGGQGGGSASSGTAQMAHPMDISNILNMKQIKAQTDLIEAQRKKVEAETPNVAPTAQADIKAKEAGAEASMAQADKARAEAEGQRIINSNTDAEMKANIATKLETVKEIGLRNKWTEEQWNIEKSKLQAESAEAWMKVQLAKTNIKMTEFEMKTMATEIVQKWTELSQRATGLSQEQQRIEIEKIKTELQNKYPSIMNVAGGAIQGAINQLESIGRYLNPMVFEYAKPEKLQNKY